MIKKYLPKSLILIFLITSFSGYSAIYYSIASTAWTVPSTWSTVGCGGAAALTIPGVGDDVIICVGTTVTMNASPGTCNSLTINGTATWAHARTTNVGNGGITINVGGNITGTFAGILTTSGGLVINATLTSTTVTIKTITTAGQAISGTGTLAKLDISANTTNNGNITVTTTLGSTILSTLTQGAAATLTYNGATAITPTLDASAAGNTVTYGGSMQTVRSATYVNLTISGSSTKTLGGAITVNGNLIVSAGSLYTSTFLITGNASGVFTLAAGTTFYIGNNGSATDVAFPSNFTNANITFSSTSTVYYYGNNGQTVSSVPTYGNLTIQTFAGSKTADGNLNVVGNLITTSPSTLALATNTLNLTGTYTGTGALSFTSGDFNIAGTYTNTGSFTAGTGTVNYNGGGAQTVCGVNYNNLTFSGAGAKTLQASTTIGIAGDFTRGAMTVSVGASNTVSFNGGIQNMTGTLTFNNLTISNTSVTINSDITINSTLTFTTGSIITGVNKVILPSSGTVSRASGHVVGNLRKYITTGSNVAKTFEVGTGSNYAPIDVVFATVSTAGNLTASTTSGDHAQIATSGFNASLTVNRYWTLTNSSIVYTTYNVTCTFVDADKDGGLTTSSCSIRLYNGATWSSPIVGTQGANATQATSVGIPVTPNTVDLQIGENGASSTGELYSIASGNWSTPGTWSETSGGVNCSCIPSNLDDVFIEGGFTVTMDGNSGSANSLTIQTGGIATWTSALTTNIGIGGIIITAAGNITGASAGVLSTSGGLVLNAVLTSTSVTIKTMTTAGQTISGTGTLGRLDISANTTNNGSITVSTLIASTIASTLTQGAAATLIYQGASVVAPSFSANAAGNTVSYTGAAQTIKSTTYQNLTIGGSSIKTLGGAITVNGNLTVSASTLYTSTFQITGNATGTFTLAAGTAFTIGNTGSATNVLFPTNFVTANISFSSTSIVSYAGNNAQTISSVPSTYGTLRAYTFSGSKTADGNINVAGDLILTSPTVLDMTTNTLNLTGDYTGTGALSLTSGTFNITGSWTNSAASFTSGTGTVNYNGGSAQTIRGYNYYNLTFSGAGTKTLEAAKTIGIAGATFARGSMTVTPGATNIVSFTGGAQNMTGNATTFTSVTINNTSLTIPADVTVNSTLTFTAGNIITNANNVIIPASGAVARTTGHVVGNLCKNVAIGVAISRTFEIGTGSDYTPLDFTFASVTTAGNLTATTTAADHPQIVTSGFLTSATVNRYWTVTNSLIVYTNYDVTCTFVNTDKDVGLPTAICVVKTYDGATWAKPTVGTQGANATQALGLTIPLTPNTIYLQIGQNLSSSGFVYSIATGNWTSPATWSATSGGASCSCIPTSVDVTTIENNYTVSMNGNPGSAKSLAINTGGVATWAAANTTNVGTSGINVAATGDITGASAGILTTTGGFVLNKALTSTTVTIKTITTSGQTISGTGTLGNLETSVNTTNNGNITLTDVLTVSGGTFTNAGTFTLKSTAVKYARIAPVTGGGAFAGDFVIERYLASRADNFWVDLSSPVSGSTLQDWDDELFLEYPFSAYFSDRPEGTNIYPYDEVSAVYYEVNSGTAMLPGQGFEVGLVDDALSVGFTTRTLNSIGTPNYGDQVINVTYTAGNGGAYQLDTDNNYSGENLIGNPFASGYPVNGISCSGTATYVDVFDNVTGNYIALTGTDIIGPHQGFWAYTSGNASGTMTFLEANKSTNNTTAIRSTNQLPYMQLTLSSKDESNTLSHTFKIAADADANDGWDIKDHLYRKSPVKSAPSIYTMIEGKKSVTNTFNSSNETYNIPLKIQVGVSGFYKIETSGLDFMSEYASIKLEDKSLNKMIDLTKENVYSFQVNVSDKSDRFILHFNKTKGVDLFGSDIVSDFINQVEILPTKQGNIINFNLNEISNTTISIVNLLGQTIVDAISIDAYNQSVNVSLPENFNGLYLVKVQSSKATITKKFIKN
jgi:fibronectin-binding autotransporter adhesin